MCLTHLRHFALLSVEQWFAWRALSRVLEVAGENSLEAATCMNNLALVFMETQQHLKAR